MKLAIPTQGNDLDSPVDPRFGRAVRFILYDDADRTWQVVDNQRALDLAQGAGIQAAQNVIETGATVLITGHCGTKAFRVLQAAGVQVVTGAQGTVAEAIAARQQGALQPATAADVEGHW